MTGGVHENRELPCVLRLSMAVALAVSLVSCEASVAGIGGSPATVAPRSVEASSQPVSHWVVELQQGDSSARVSAAQALVALGAQAVAALPELLRMLREPTVAPLAAEVLSGLGESARPAVPTFIQGLRSEDPDLRAASAQALERLGAVAVPDLVLALQQQGLESLEGPGECWRYLVRREPEAVTVGLSLVTLAALAAAVAIARVWAGHRERLARIAAAGSATRSDSASAPAS